MNKILVFIGVVLYLFLSACEQDQTPEWKAAPNFLMTRWSGDVDPEMPWPKYPRPQMVREDWMNLNGLWDFQLLKKGETPGDYTQKILVPYPVESALSGIADSVGPGDVIWYRRNFKIPSEWDGKDVLLNFEAVDWKTTVVVNDEEVGTHSGGYDPFTFNITDFIRDYKVNELVVIVMDPTDQGHQPRGKQVLNPHGIWYTPTSGIWQTVWLEPVVQTHITDFIIIPEPDLSKVEFIINGQLPDQDYIVEITTEDGSGLKVNGAPGVKFSMELSDFQWWTPDNPHLYEVTIFLKKGDKVLDKVRSYFGMRKIEKCSDDDGFVGLCLNNDIVFQNGPLDQGFWPDGLYTPPTDEAMKYDIEMTKAMGFNMLRKHVKVETRRFYFWCDKLGIMVWQDMPSTGGYVAPDKPDMQRPKEETDQFKYELERLIMTKYNHPSIIMWVPFNEGWGQFDTEGIVDFIYALDPSRLVNNTSGWADRGVGDVMDIHHYPDPRCPEPEKNRASVLGEFGGLGLYVEGHTWEQKNWGYQKMSDADSLLIKYEQFYEIIWGMKEDKGLAACIYTQTTDVETETNGLMTYDRAVIKMDAEVLKMINRND